MKPSSDIDMLRLTLLIPSLVSCRAPPTPKGCSWLMPGGRVPVGRDRHVDQILFSSIDLVVIDCRAAPDEEAVVLRVVDSCRRIDARERLHGVHVLPQREREDLGALAVGAVKNPRTEIAGRRAVVGYPGVTHIGHVLAGVLVAYRTAPDPRNHSPSSSPRPSGE